MLEGHLDPVQVEIVPMHTEVYKAQKGAGSVVHTHAHHATAFALAHQELPVAYEAMIRAGFREAVPVAPWAPRGSGASVSNIVDLVRSHPGVPAVLLANHGLLAFAEDAFKTARVIAAMEEGAQLTIEARLLGGERPLPEGAFDREWEHMRSHGSGS